MTTTIHVRELTKSFRSRVALAGVSFDVGPGVTGVLGPNGAGKTTLLRIIATALAPDSGEVQVLGRRPARDHDRLAIRRQVGYLPQDTGLYRGFTAYDFIDYVAILKEISDPTQRRDEVRRVLAGVGLEDRMHSKIKTLSGGMRRRVELAQALLGAPRLLVLDEPTVGLDPVQRLRFRETVSAVASHDTVLLSTHLTEDVAALCGHVIVIDQGQVLFAGRPSELAARADGRVWESEAADAGATLSWLTGQGRHRHIGSPPDGAALVTPRLEDGYLLLTASEPFAVTS